jgi:hypothetical protein
MAEQKEQWARVPVEAIKDERLSPTEFRVLVALLSFADFLTGWTWPTARSTIARRCGVSPQNISRSTAALVRYGWLEKFGNGGRSCPAKYRIVNPFVTRPDSGQVKGKTRPESDTKTRPESDTKTRPDSGRGKEQSFSQTFEQKAAKRLHELARILDRLPYQPDQANPLLISMADELGLTAGSGQSTFDFATRLRREIETRLADAESAHWVH